MRKEQVIVRRIHSERVGVLIYKATGAKPEECKHPRGKKKDHLHKHTNDNVEILEPFLLGLMNQNRQTNSRNSTRLVVYDQITKWLQCIFCIMSCLQHPSPKPSVYLSRHCQKVPYIKFDPSWPYLWNSCTSCSMLNHFKENIFNLHMSFHRTFMNSFSSVLELWKRSFSCHLSTSQFKKKKRVPLFL